MLQRHTAVPARRADAPVGPEGADDCESDEARQACSVLEAMNKVSGKWSIGILLMTTQAPVRYTELERGVKGISRRMLTLTLRNLERDGLVTRTIYPTVPPRVEYAATPVARELYDTLLSLAGWAQRHHDGIAQAQVRYDRDAAASRPDGTGIAAAAAYSH